MSHEIMSNPELEGAEARDQRIFEITGIQPDPRDKIPSLEFQQLVLGTQAGDVAAMEGLIATRLNWIYDRYVQNDLTRDRFDLDETDILQMGSVAVLEAAHQVEVDDPNFKEVFYKQTRQQLVGQIMSAKLVPTISEAGHKLMNARDRNLEGRMRENVVPVGDFGDVAIVGHETAINHGTPEKAVLAMETPEIVKSSMNVLNEAERNIIETRYGLDIFSDLTPLSFAEIGDMLGLNREVVRKMHEKALEKLGEAYETVTSGPKPRWSPKQEALQKKWLREIERKQEAGKIAFVTGSLLERRLPEPVGLYLLMNYVDEEDTPSVEFQAALREAAEEEFRAHRLTSVAA